MPMPARHVVFEIATPAWTQWVDENADMIKDNILVEIDTIPGAPVAFEPAPGGDGDPWLVQGDGVARGATIMQARPVRATRTDGLVTLRVAVRRWRPDGLVDGDTVAITGAGYLIAPSPSTVRLMRAGKPGHVFLALMAVGYPRALAWVLVNGEEVDKDVFDQEMGWDNRW